MRRLIVIRKSRALIMLPRRFQLVVSLIVLEALVELLLVLAVVLVRQLVELQVIQVYLMVVIIIHRRRCHR